MNSDKIPLRNHVSAETMRLNPHLYVNSHTPKSPIQNPKPERDERPALGATVSGKTEGDGRAIVRFIGYRVRPLDPDNFAGSVKNLLDGLHKAQIISGDEYWRIKLETDQVKVAHKSEERTEVEVILP